MMKFEIKTDRNKERLIATIDAELMDMIKALMKKYNEGRSSIVNNILKNFKLNIYNKDEKTN